ncbi:DUF4355 domain-containing protein [Metasolibacillus meyeri]|uniref:DUF4355 domain-containing protein n=1 Tax=Metasolibacillus meyeri TaxID=1071052 RepID=UPI00187D506B|nr:DUF4355 domain-containing protein [Metasolibacillus meyeri]
MKVNFEQLKALVEAGDKAALEKHIYESLEKGDLTTAATSNAAVKSELDSEKDKHHNTALDTWKANNLQGLIDAEVAKHNPEETPEQKRIRELEEKLQQNELKEQRAAAKEKAIAYMTEKGYDAAFAAKYADKFLDADEITTNAFLDNFKTDFDAFVQASVEERMKGAARNPGGGAGSGGSEQSFGARLAESTNTQQNQEALNHYFK